MKKLISVVALAVAAQFAFAPAALAATAQQNKMKECNVQAGDKKGDERKAFMKECLSAKKAEEKSAKTSQQEKMKTCNADAGKQNLKGDKRKAFMKECLSN